MFDTTGEANKKNTTVKFTLGTLYCNLQYYLKVKQTFHTAEINNLFLPRFVISEIETPHNLYGAYVQLLS